MRYFVATIVSAFIVSIVAPPAFAGNVPQRKAGKGKTPSAAQKKGHIGVIIQTPASAGLKDVKGIVILGAFPGLPAYKSGLRAGDVILKVDGNDVPDSTKETVAMITSRGPGKTVKIEYRRGEKTAEATVTLGNPVTAQELIAALKQVAEKGESWAQDQLGNYYRFGKGVEKDYGKAAEWYRKAADQKFPSAYVHLGEIYILGQGVEKDAKKAVEWIRKGTDKSLPSAQYLLGFCNEKGVGMDKDAKKAVNWYRLAAKGGHVRGQFSLGLSYIQGQVVEKDNAKAFKWFHESAKQGFSAAQFNVGFMYERGLGVKMDVKEATRWYERSAAQGFERAKKKLKELNP